jgi:hypothetical protein
MWKIPQEGTNLVRLETRKKASIFERKKIERIYSEAR